jgi:hypothetical protein
LKIIFLDIDGPLISHRALQLTENQSGWYEDEANVPPLPHPIPQTFGVDSSLSQRRKFDPVAVALLNKLTVGHNARLVISSSWRNVGRKNMEFILGENGISPDRLHEVWKTPARLSSSRGDEISMWLNEIEHPDPIEAYVALDDDASICKLHGHVLVTFRDGMQWEHFCSASAALGGGIPLKRSKIEGEFIVGEVGMGRLGERVINAFGHSPLTYKFGPIDKYAPKPDGCLRIVGEYSLIRFPSE